MIYLDHAATTPVHQEVLDVMYPLFTQNFGNPSSLHEYGRKARNLTDTARRYLAGTINAKEHEIVMTSGGTESNNIAVSGTALENEYKGNHIITSSQEHHAILHIMEYLISRGFHVTYLPVDESGLINVNDLKRTLTDQTILVSIMTANNETGALQPIEEIGELLKDHQAYFHTDAVQAYSLLDIDVKKLGIDLLTTSAHKLNGPKGIGFLYINEDVQIQPIQYGGEQEGKKRPGTENVMGAVGFQKAAELAQENKRENNKKYQKFKQIFLDTLDDEEVNYLINGDLDQSITTILNISFPGLKTETLLTVFDIEGIAVSSASACTAGSVEPSHVLTAMYGQRNDRINSSVRFSFGSMNTKENVKEAALKISSVIKRLKPSEG